MMAEIPQSSQVMIAVLCLILGLAFLGSCLWGALQWIIEKGIFHR